ncbi:hypothetical protein [Pseudoalteromonas phage J2-1]|uniref:Tail tape measure protein n=1 Tax=Pseudoalteromonas phage J2-1 TaxID=2023998 RepID=A0A223LG13_9CAUD|nr:hypothetical protein HOR90_gp80 [Pseudoalteromonas phage J2-1]ASU03367.1 hypothetical protein [Pseudoalteromonas phage J2-1]
MEQGQLASSEVLPKVAKEFRKAALEGGAYALALQGLRVKEGQFMTGMQRAGKTIFNSGFEEGLSNLYGTLSEIFENSGSQLKKLGKIFGDVFNAIATGLKILEPVMKLAIDNFYTLVGVKAIFMVRSFVGALTTQSYLAAAAWTRMFLPVTLALAAMDELYSMMDDTKIGALEASYGKQINILDGTTSDFTRIGDKFYRKDNLKPKGNNLDMRNMTEEQFDKLGWWDKLKAIGSMQNKMVRGAFVGATTEGRGGLVGDLLVGRAGSPTGTTVTNNIVINNGQMDELKRALAGKESVATQARGK